MTFRPLQPNPEIITWSKILGSNTIYTRHQNKTGLITHHCENGVVLVAFDSSGQSSSEQLQLRCVHKQFSIWVDRTEGSNVDLYLSMGGR